MNNKGQTIIIMIIFLPIILLILTLIIDLGLVQQEKTKLTSVTKTIINEVYDSYDEKVGKDKIIELYQKNDITYDQLLVNYQEKKLTIKLKKKIKGIFGKIINYDQFNLEINLTGYKENDKLIIEKG